MLELRRTKPIKNKGREIMTTLEINRETSYLCRSYKFHFDAGHGWLEVDKTDLDLLGIADKISSCSYAKGNTVYLEEDCDLTLFAKTLEAKFPKFKLDHNIIDVDNGDSSVIRNLPSYDGKTEFVFTTRNGSYTQRI